MTYFSSNHNLTTESFLVTRQQKEKLNQHKAFTIWLTGLPGSGKSTLARNLEVSLFNAGIRTLILDGDNTRMSVNRDLDFSAVGRQENIRRVAEIAKLLNDAGVVVITAFISPLKANRSMAQTIIGDECFVEAFVDTPLEICMERDPKGLYKKAMDGQLPDFTGIGSPYERPEHPRITVSTAHQSPEDSVRYIISQLNYYKHIKLCL